MSEAPYTVEGAYVLHQFFRCRRDAPAAAREEAAGVLERLFTRGDQDEAGAAYRILGHKADLALVHLRRTPEELLEVERRLARLALAPYLELTWSYFSVVELSVHGAADRHGEALRKRGLEPGTEEWERAAEEMLAREREALRPRLYPELPPTRYFCFYPMSKRRGEERNWYLLGSRERAELMRGHARVGRRYRDRVVQIISSSVGLDDWEWGVDLFADDVLWFKKLVYEMRFDPASALYAEFGPFLVGLRRSPGELFE